MKHYPIFLFSIILFLYRIVQMKFPWIALVLLCGYWLLRTKDRSVIVAAFLLYLSNFTYYQTTIPQTLNGTVWKVSGSSYVIRSGRHKYLLYTDETLLFDSKIEVDGEVQELTPMISFYGSTTTVRQQRDGIHYAVSNPDIHIVKEGSSFRARLQRSISACSTTEERALLNRIVLGIYEQSSFSTYLYEYGFSLTGILSFFSYMLRYTLDLKKRRKWTIALGMVLAILYHFPLILVQYVISQILAETQIPKDMQIGITACLILAIFPSAYMNPSFLIPTIYRILNHFVRKKEIYPFAIFHIQSILFHKWNPVLTVFYQSIHPVLGFLWITAVFYCLIKHPLLFHILKSASALSGILERYTIQGSIVGFGLPIYLMLLYSVHKLRFHQYLYYSILIIFLAFGLFHPFGEVTFINVGQGDSILIRAPLNQGNILIDTGKPNQLHRLKAILDAKQIHSLDALIVTHDDNDHSGNKADVIQAYHPPLVLDSHHEPLQVGPLLLQDLNQIENEDENQSSLVEIFQLNGLIYLLMGDADEVTEQSIISSYGNLQCDILKLSHHGSKTGSCDEFLDGASPNIAIVSAGSYSLYHHPAPETIQKLLKRHIPYFNTREDGDISIISLGYHLNLVITASGKIGIIFS